MLHVLLESGAHTTDRRAGWAVASILAHAALVTSAVALTTRDSVLRIEREVRQQLVYVMPREVARPAEMRSRSDVAGSIARVLREVPTIVVPSILPENPILAFEEPVFPLERPGTDSVTGARHGGSDVPQGGIYVVGLVDRIVVPHADNPQPDYPSALRASAVDGEVLVRFVVDSTGRVEPSSVEILRATHPLFGDAVRRWLRRTHYVPAEAAGRQVRQLVEQRVTFTLRPPRP